ncbi:hypothetical protein ACQSSU_12895 [Micromonospora echinospora]
MSSQGWRVLVACLLAALGSAAISIVYTIEADHRAERRWCDIVTALDDAYRQSPPTTPTGQRIADAVVGMRRDFHCPS